MQDSDAIDEVDLAIFHALEIAPRATWAAVGQAVGIDPVTAARRWTALEEANLAWVTSYPLLARETTAMLVEIHCSAHCVRSVAAVVARCSLAMSVDIVSGTSDILVLAGGASARVLRDFVLSRLPVIEGVLRVTTHPIVAVHVDSGLVAEGSLTQSSRQTLPAHRRGTLVPTALPADDLDWALCLELSRHGRMSVAALSRAAGATEPTVKRRLSKLTSDGALHLRAVLAPAAAPQQVVVWLRLQVPPDEVAASVSAIARMTGVKFVALVAGPDNLEVQVVLSNIAVLEALESRIHRNHPHIRISNRTVVLEHVRHIARVFDERGLASETVSIDIRSCSPMQSVAPSLTENIARP